MSDDLILDIDGAVAVVTLNRPDKRNCISYALLHAMAEMFADIDSDPKVRVAIVTGAGPAFCAGADLGDLIPRVAAGGLGLAIPDRTKRMLSDIRMPVIAAVNGACLAGGLELLLGTDVRIAANTAVFGAPEVRHGLFAAGGTTVRLLRQIPFAVAQELLLTGRPIGAERAYQVGLINKVVAPELLMDEAREWAQAISDNGPLAVAATKEAVISVLSLEDGFRTESLIADRVFASKDATEGMRSFTERRRPEFTGE